MQNRFQSRWVQLLMRWAALGSAALVVALCVAAASPSLHEKLHGGHGQGDDACAVVLFANGVCSVAGTIAVNPPTQSWSAPRAIYGSEVLLTAPRYLRQPERGPPALS